MSMKNPQTPVGIEPATFRFVTQHLNHCATAVPLTNEYEEYFLDSKGGQCVGLTTLPLSCADYLEIVRTSKTWSSRAYPGPYSDLCIL